MGAINVSLLKPGMILEEDVRSSHGRLLVEKGTELAPRHIKLMKTWGIADAQIQDGDKLMVELLNSFPSDVVEQSRTITRHRFSLLDLADPLTLTLYHLSLLHTAQEASEGRIKDVPYNGEGKTSKCLKVVTNPMDPARLVEDDPRLATLPGTYLNIKRALNKPKCTATHLAEIVSLDTSLAAKLLRLVNSPYFGLIQPVDTLDRAIVVAGIDHLSELVLGLSVVTMFHNIPMGILCMREFWQHSVLTAHIAKLIAVRVPEADEERCFAAGLLHDIGRMIMLIEHPPLSRLTVNHAASCALLLTTSEREIWGFDHSLVGGLLFDKWGLPKPMCDTIRDHHSPEGNMALETMIIHTADFLAHVMVRGSSALDLIPPISPAMSVQLDITANSLWTIGLQAVNLMEGTRHVFLPDN